MPDDSPQFQIARGTVKFEADQSAIDDALTSLEKRLDTIAGKVKDAFNIGPVIEQAEQRLAELERRAAEIKLPSIPEPDQPAAPVPHRREGEPPAVPFNLDKEMAAAKTQDAVQETNRLLEDIKQYIIQLIETRGDD